MRNVLTVLAFLCFFTQYGYGQERTVSGRVVGAADSLPVPGVSVTVQGSSIGTATDLEGNYTISVPGNEAVLLFSFLGMTTVQETVGDRSVINVVLAPAASQLDEVVVIGYGTAVKRDLTGSIVSIDGSEVADKPATNPVASLQGKVAGVHITNSGRPGAEPDIRIRGTNTIHGIKPLYVVDGILNDNIDYLNPSDIESIEILKDPSSLAIFGVRGANGVIAITTKQAKAGELNFNFNSTVGFKQVSDPMDMTDAAGFKMLYDEQLVNDGATPYNYEKWTANTDWQDEIFQKGILNYNHLSVSGATEKNKFYMGLGYTTEQGMIKHEQLNKITLSLNDELQLNENLRVGINFNGYRSELPQNREVDAAIRAAPIAPVFHEESGLYHTLPDFQRAQIWNPMVNVELRKNTLISRQYRAVGSVFAEVDFLEDFTFRAAFLADYGFNQSRSYSPLINVYNPDIAGDGIDHLVETTSVNQSQDIYTKVQSDWLLTYKNSFNDHNLTAMAGWTSYYNSFEGTSGHRTQGDGRPIPNEPRFWYVDIGDSDTQTGTGSAWERANLSFLSRVLYNYKYKYLLNLSYRRDGSSGFLPENPKRWQNFASVGAAWVVSEEDFMKSQSTVNLLKLKGSWGLLGNQNTGDQYRYPAYPLLVPGNSAVFGDDVVPAYEPDYIADPNLHWESVYAWEAGFELNAFKNRLYVEAVWYDKKTEDILVTVPGTLGSRPGLSNVGSISNHGLELAASWNQELGEDLSLSVSGNFTTVDNEVLDLVSEGYEIFNGISRTAIGYPIGYFYGYISDGIYQTDTEIRQSPTNQINEVKPGDIKYRDVNGDGNITQDDRTLIGNPTPDFTYGIALSLNYRGFDVSADFTGVYGNELFRDWNRGSFSQFNFQEHMLDRWHGAGTSNWEPLISSRSNNRLVSTYYIEDGSFFRVRNIQLGYNLNRQTLEKLGLKALRIYLNAQNPWTFTNSTGYTPEIGGSSTSFGIDNGTYPVPAIYTLGVNLNF
ncbi:TonB-linked SusC/RagA family outer membrane protein [Anseongella ginsenosidimutans]|uniref:TonB-linked SusC/RagA family outer membrane protein n=1 Tax=Anseongella ginsenosidimutans TaxID=496056 RepID=A0A4R3KN29_9SPHI|nr:TonB-dependent receptor [Anseongella ginsenosidimutans]QEC52405.1 TonB-dependent receptor [Anseongella ginsenosidimutans]TCS85851.1 TonB-linked SusC/RagA family outer membrane protein [Anseongella ginsenosidimutans]